MSIQEALTAQEQRAPNVCRAVNVKQENYDVYIGRAGHGQSGYYGNPIKRNYDERPGSTLARYKKYFDARLQTDPLFKERIKALKGLKLGCFCKPNPCHGDIIAAYVNSL